MGSHSERAGCEIGSVRLRVRTALDISVLVLMLREVHETTGYPTRWPTDPPRWLAAKAGYGAWVAEVAGELCGHVGLQQVQEPDCRLAWLTVTGRQPEQLAEVSRLFVAPDAKGLGVGPRLLQHAVQAAHARSAWPVLDVVADGRTAAEHLYRACGWQHAGRESWSPGDGRELTVNSWTGPPDR